jgi:cytochrome c2
VSRIQPPFPGLKQGSEFLFWLPVLAGLIVTSLIVASTISTNPVRGNEPKADDGHGFVKAPKSYVPAVDTKDSQKGKELFKQYNCSVCHSLGNAGGCLAPPLSGVGARRSKDFLLTRITKGKANEEKFASLYGSELMPHLRLPPVDARCVVNYLLTLPEPSHGFEVGKHQPNVIGVSKNTAIKQDIHSSPAKPTFGPENEVLVSEGKKLFYERGCLSCHSIKGVGGQFAPNLDGIGKRKSFEDIALQLGNAELLALPSISEYNERGTVMPPSGLTESEVRKISAFLASM